MPTSALSRPPSNAARDIAQSDTRALAGVSGASDAASLRDTVLAPSTDPLCFHCGQPLPAAPEVLHGDLDGAQRPFCCGGCLALAQALHAAGFGHLYGDDARFARPLDGVALDEARAIWLAYDTPELAGQFIRELGDGRVEMSLAPENIRCAACAWLIEQRLSALQAVESVVANVATRRVVVRWRGDALPVSGLLAEFAQLGYPAVPFEVSRSDARDSQARRSLLMRVAVAMLGMMQVMMYAWPLYMHEHRIDPGHLQLMRWTSFALTLPVVLYSALPILMGAWRDLRARRTGMDVPVALGIGAAFVASVAATIAGEGAVYFDSVTMFVAFLLLARYLELRVRQASRSGAEMLARQLPATCERIGGTGDASRRPGDHGGDGNGDDSRSFGAETRGERIPVVRLRAGDRILVRAGDIVPADGQVTSGASDVDESMLTGESRPVRKEAGSRLLAGCFNATSPLVLRVERVGAGTRLAEIVNLLDRALAEKPRLAALADRVAGWFIAVLLCLAAATGIVWWQIDTSRALAVTIAVLVVSCPCALSLATPAALAAAGAALSRRGLLVTRGHALETLARVTDVVLDKTGTLTEGRFALVAIHAAGGEMAGRDCLALAAALERSGEHPLAHGLVEAADRLGHAAGTGNEAAREANAAGAAGAADARENACGIEALRNVPGQGIEARVNGRRIRLGRQSFVLGIEQSSGVPGGAGCPVTPVPGLTGGPVRGAACEVAGIPSSREGATQVWLGDEAGVMAIFVLADRERVQTARLLAALHRRGVHCHLVSGDGEPTVRWWAAHLGIERYRGAMTPEDKRDYVDALQRNGAVVLAVGDGINDAPVLAQAQVSIAVGSGAPLAQAGADLVLTHGGVAEIAAALTMARRTGAVMRQNLGWAFTYNVIAIPLAATGHVTAWMAGIGMSVSSLLVVANAWRLLRAPRDPGTATEGRRDAAGADRAAPGAS